MDLQASSFILECFRSKVPLQFRMLIIRVAASDVYYASCVTVSSLSPLLSLFAGLTSIYFNITLVFCQWLFRYSSRSTVHSCAFETIACISSSGKAVSSETLGTRHFKPVQFVVGEIDLGVAACVITLLFVCHLRFCNFVRHPF